MNYLEKFWRAVVKRAVVYAGIPLRDPGLVALLGISPITSSGVPIDERNALTIPAVFAAVRVLAESVAYLPLLVYERLPGGGKERASGHPLYELLHDQPNKYMTSVTFRETLQAHLSLWGNAYAEIEWGGNGEARALWPLLPNRVLPEVNKGFLFYRVSLPDGGQQVLAPEDVLHIPGLGFDGIKGYSPVTLTREALGLAKAGEEFAARFYQNGVAVSGILEHPGQLGEEAANRLRSSVEGRHAGLGQAHRMMILEEGLKFSSSMPLKDAQFLEGRKFQISEIARMFRVPPHMLADLERATFSNIEHQSLEFVIFTLGPWLRRWEQELTRKLFASQGRRRYLIEFNIDGLLRGDITSRYGAYAVGRQWGWLSADDIRELENQNPLPDKAGKIYLTPLNMADAAAPVKPPVVKPAPSAPAEKPSDQEEEENAL